MRILVTGFEAFGGRDSNSSAAVVEALAGEVEAAILPVAYARAADALREAVASVEPELVVCFGQADGRVGVTVERVALNLDDAERADNEGVVSAQPIRSGGPAAYWSRLPVDEIVAALRAAAIPAASSRDAGGYLCNHVFYSLMDLLADGDVPAGFVHLPLLPEQALDADSPTMPLETQVRAARIVVAVSSTRARGTHHGARTRA
jgi:pyroglutamyl-peptidase